MFQSQGFLLSGPDILSLARDGRVFVLISAIHEPLGIILDPYLFWFAAPIISLPACTETVGTRPC